MSGDAAAEEGGCASTNVKARLFCSVSLGAAFRYWSEGKNRRWMAFAVAQSPPDADWTPP